MLAYSTPPSPLAGDSTTSCLPSLELHCDVSKEHSERRKKGVAIPNCSTVIIVKRIKIVPEWDLGLTDS